MSRPPAPSSADPPAGPSADRSADTPTGGPTGPSAATITPPRRSLAQRLRDWNPLFLLFGPTFQREMRVSGRKRSTYTFRCLYVVGLLALVALAYIGPRSNLEQGGGVVTVQAFQGIAVAITLVIVWFQFFVLGMMSPSLTGGAISDEKRARTLPALLTTPLSAGEIVLGKLSSRLILLLILSVLSAPMLLAVRVFGGAPTELVLMALAICLTTGVLAASSALMASNWLTKASSASSLGFGLVIVINLIPLALFRLYAYQGWPISGGIQWIWGLCAPFLLFRVSTEVGAPGALSGMTPSLDDLFLMNTLVNLGLSTLAAGIAVLSFRRSMRSEAVIEPKTKRRRGGRRARAAGTAAVPEAPERGELAEVLEGEPGDPSAAPDAGPIEPGAAHAATDESEDDESRASRTIGDRPVLWRELRQRAFKTRARKWIMIAIGLVLAFLFYTNISVSDAEAYEFVPMLAVFVVAGQAIALTTSNIPAEREARTWESLLTTPLSGREIALSKFFGSLRRAWFIPALAVFHLGVLGVTNGVVRPIMIAHLIMIMVGVLMLLAGTGLFFGLHARKGSSASSLNFLLAASLWLFVPMLAGMIDGLFPIPVPTGVWVLISAINPMALSVSSRTGGIAETWSVGMGPGGSPTFSTGFDMPGGDWGVVSFTLLVAGFMVAASLIGLAAALYTGSRLRNVRTDR